MPTFKSLDRSRFHLRNCANRVGGATRPCDRYLRLATSAEMGRPIWQWLAGCKGFDLLDHHASPEAELGH